MNDSQENAGKMNILDLLKNILPFVLPYRWLVGITLTLTVISSLMAQVNAVVLDRAVDAIKHGRTVIIISHNIGQIIDAEQIYVLQQGRVVQHGSPSDIYQQGGVYKDIFDASARSMNVDKIANTIGGA